MFLSRYSTLDFHNFRFSLVFFSAFLLTNYDTQTFGQAVVYLHVSAIRIRFAVVHLRSLDIFPNPPYVVSSFADLIGVLLRWGGGMC